MRGVIVICAVSLAACTSGTSDIAVQTPTAVNALFADALAARATPLAAGDTIDQRRVAAAGWRVTDRTTQLQVTNTSHALTEYPTLRRGEYEATTWTHPGRIGEMEIIRWDDVAPTIADHCETNARVATALEVPAVIAGLSRTLGRPIAREGDMPRGGDFLTPRFDSAPHAYYWLLPNHDIYMVRQEDTSLRLEIVAMPDRDALDQYSSDRPERRIPSGENPQ